MGRLLFFGAFSFASLIYLNLTLAEPHRPEVTSTSAYPFLDLKDENQRKTEQQLNACGKDLLCTHRLLSQVSQLYRDELLFSFRSIGNTYQRLGNKLNRVQFDYSFPQALLDQFKRIDEQHKKNISSCRALQVRLISKDAAFDLIKITYSPLIGVFLAGNSLINVYQQIYNRETTDIGHSHTHAYCSSLENRSFLAFVIQTKRLLDPVLVSLSQIEAEIQSQDQNKI